MTTKFVLDASIVLKLALYEEHSGEVLDFIEKHRGGDFLCPEIIFSEVGNGLWKRVKAGGMSLQEARRLYDSLQIEELLRPVSLAFLIRPAFDVAQKINHTALHDCCYLALAQKENAEFVTADRVFFDKAVAAGYRQHLLFITEL